MIFLGYITETIKPKECNYIFCLLYLLTLLDFLYLNVKRLNIYNILVFFTIGKISKTIITFNGTLEKTQCPLCKINIEE